MSHPIPVTSRLLPLLAIVVGMILGCGPTTEPVESTELRSNMRSLAVAYGGYMRENRGRPPKNEAAFRKWLDKQGPDYPEILKVDSIDEIFVSSRDNEPYVIAYGKPKRTVAYEAVGVDGKRFVADDLGVVEELDADAFAERVPDAE